MIFKRITNLILLLILSISFTTNLSANEYKEYTSAMYAFGSTNVYSISSKNEHLNKQQINKYLSDAKELTLKLSDLSDNFNLIKKNDKYIHNVKYINDNPNKNIEIDKMLYDLLVLSEKYKKDTDGYFDISIGNIIDEWKKLLDTSPNKLTKYEFERKIDDIHKIPIIKNGISLFKENNKYYVNIKSGVKIDLGGIAKGHSIELVDQFYRNEGIIYYRLEGSESSLKYGKNADPSRENEFYHIGIRHPFISGTYGYFKIKDINVTTSGDTVQNELIHGKFMHHIISPHSKEPENNYRTLTLINDDATYGDVLSTAMFSMPKKEMVKWAKKNDIEFIAIEYDGTVIKNINKTGFVILNEEFNKKPDVEILSTVYDVSYTFNDGNDVSFEITVDPKSIISDVNIKSSTLSYIKQDEFIETLLNVNLRKVDLTNKEDEEFDEEISLLISKVKNAHFKNKDVEEEDFKFSFKNYYFKTIKVSNVSELVSTLTKWILISLAIILVGIAVFAAGSRANSKEE